MTSDRGLRSTTRAGALLLPLPLLPPLLLEPEAS